MKIRSKGTYTLTLSDKEARQLFSDISNLHHILYDSFTTLSDVNELVRNGGLGTLLELKSSLYDILPGSTTTK